MKAKDVLEKCTVNGNIVKLPDIQLDRKLYLQVAKKLNLIGGKWNRGKKGFVFQEDPSDLLNDIAGDENRNLKKEFQFFATPSKLAHLLVALAEVEDGNKILEPSAGQGAIIDEILRLHPDADIDCYELMTINIRILKQRYCSDPSTVTYVGDDYLKADCKGAYDRIIANPPFSKNQDIDHIRKMYSDVKPGGVVVTIASRHWQYCNNRKETEFREWLKNDVDSWVDNDLINFGDFKESGTMIKPCVVTINKPLNQKDGTK